MSRTRETWSAKFANIGTRLIHKYSGNTMFGTEYMVYLSLRLHRDENRIVEYVMSAEEAKFLIYQLGEYVARAEEYNEGL